MADWERVGAGGVEMDLLAGWRLARLSLLSANLMSHAAWSEADGLPSDPAAADGQEPDSSDPDAASSIGGSGPVLPAGGLVLRRRRRSRRRRLRSWYRSSEAIILSEGRWAKSSR